MFMFIETYLKRPAASQLGWTLSPGKTQVMTTAPPGPLMKHRLYKHVLFFPSFVPFDTVQCTMDVLCAWEAFMLE